MSITTPYLRQLRLRRFMPAHELAERSGLTTMTIWRLENGKRAHMLTVRRLAAALDVDPHDIAEVHEVDPSGAER